MRGFSLLGEFIIRGSTVLELMYVLCNVYLQAETGFDGKVLKQGFLLKKVKFMQCICKCLLSVS